MYDNITIKVWDLIPHLSSLTRVSWRRMVLWLLYNPDKGKPFKGGSVCSNWYCSIQNASTEEQHLSKFTFKLNHSLVLTWGRSVWPSPKCFNRGNTAPTSLSSWIILVTDLTSGKYPLSRIYQILLIPLVSHNKDQFVSSKIDVWLCDLYALVDLLKN